MIGTVLLCILLPLLFYWYKKINRKYTFFKEKNIKHLKPVFFFGNSWDILLGRKHNTEQIGLLYDTFQSEDIVGHYEFIQPSYVIKNPEYVDRILTTDFSYFHDRVPGSEEIKEPADANLFVVPGNTWRAIRQKFSPLFSSGKLNYMYSSLLGCANNLITVLDQKDKTDVELFDLMGLFAMDVIGSTAFGIEPNLLENPNSRFRVEGKKVFAPSHFQNMKNIIKYFFPEVGQLLGLSSSFVSNETQQYFYNIIMNTMKTRKESGLERNDFVQMLLHLKEKGKIEIPIHEKGDEYLMMENGSKETFEIEVTDNILVGGSFTFLVAGFHAAAVTLAFALYELARKPQVQKMLREEIKSNVKEEDPTYEELKNMPFLEKVIKETSRLHPSVGLLSRFCTKDYTFPNGMEISQGRGLFIPVSSIQMDPQYWEEPEEFNPERWERDPAPGTYLPFGNGPRVCIAMRFAMMEMKLALTKLIGRYNFTLSNKTEIPPRLHPRVFLTTPLNGITLNVNKLDN